MAPWVVQQEIGVFSCHGSQGAKVSTTSVADTYDLSVKIYPVYKLLTGQKYCKNDRDRNIGVYVLALTPWAT